VALTALATAAVIGLISRVFQKAKPSVVSDTAAAIEPEKSTAWFTVIGGCVMALAGLYETLFGGMGPRGWLVILLGLCIAGFMSPSLTSVHKVTWEEDAT
jgi:NhaP-type Na+/H+ or K+/H+ antiporter